VQRRLRLSVVVWPGPVEEFEDVLRRHGEDDGVVGRVAAGSAVEHRPEPALRVRRDALEPRAEGDAVRGARVKELLDDAVRAVARQVVGIRVVFREPEVRSPRRRSLHAVERARRSAVGRAHGLQQVPRLARANAHVLRARVRPRTAAATLVPRRRRAAARAARHVRDVDAGAVAERFADVVRGERARQARADDQHAARSRRGEVLRAHLCGCAVKRPPSVGVAPPSARRLQHLRLAVWLSPRADLAGSRYAPLGFLGPARARERSVARARV